MTRSPNGSHTLIYFDNHPDRRDIALAGCIIEIVARKMLQLHQATT
jgi:hypothetical protein